MQKTSTTTHLAQHPQQLQTSDDDLSASDVEQEGSRKVALFKAPSTTDKVPIHAKHTTFQGIGDSGLAHIKGWQILKICYSKVRGAIGAVRTQTPPDDNVFVITNGADFLKYAGAFAVSQVKETDSPPFFDRDGTIRIQVGASQQFDVDLRVGFKRIRDVDSFAGLMPFLQNPDLAVVLPDNSVYIKTGKALPKNAEEAKSIGLTALVVFKFPLSYEDVFIDSDEDEVGSGVDPLPDSKLTELKKQMSDNEFSECVSLTAKFNSSDTYAAFKEVAKPVSERISYEFPKKDGVEAKKEDLPYFSTLKLSLVSMIDKMKEMGVTGKMIADIQLAFLRGASDDELKTLLPHDLKSKNSIMKNIHFITSLIFGVEGSRLNMHYVTTAMQLELVSAGKMEYKDLIYTDSYGGQLPLAAFGSGAGTFSTIRDRLRGQNDSMTSERSSAKVYKTGSLTYQQQHQVQTKIAMVIKNYVRFKYPKTSARTKEIDKIEKRIESAITHILTTYFGYVEPAEAE